MLELSSLETVARALDMSSFIARYPRPFLLERRSSRQQNHDQIHYDTLVSEESGVSVLEEVRLRKMWRAVEIAKRPGNPFPERISIGRANNCDIVLRRSFISKLHAHFVVGEDGALAIVDNGSSNGTKHNGVRLVPRRATPVMPGDILGFVSFHLELVDSASLYNLLCGRANVSAA